METKNESRTNGMVDALNQETFQKVREQILLLADNGYRVPEIPEVTDTGNIVTLFKKITGNGQVYSIPKDVSKSKHKHLRRLAYRFLQRQSWCNANLYLHFLFKKVLELETIPKIHLPEKEEKIIAARKAWKKAQAEAEKLRVAYRSEKGDYYKNKK